MFRSDLQTRDWVFFPDWSVIFFRSFVISRRSSQAAKGASLEHLRSFHHKVPLWWENKEKKKKKYSFFKIAANQVSLCCYHPTVRRQLLLQPSWTYPSLFCYSLLSFETNRPLFLSKHMTCRCFINPPCNFFGHIFCCLSKQIANAREGGKPSTNPPIQYKFRFTARSLFLWLTYTHAHSHTLSLSL